VAVPNTKISETIMDFGDPLFCLFDQPPPSPELLRVPFEIVLAVWNAHVMAMPCWGKPELLVWLQDIYYRSPETAPMLNTFEQLARRRYAKFADDPRAVGAWDLIVNSAGEPRFQCDGRIPPGYVQQPDKATASHIYLKLQS
jgi:hypothetical protein